MFIEIINELNARNKKRKIKNRFIAIAMGMNELTFNFWRMIRQEQLKYKFRNDG